jgi:hypothetical protein
LRLARRGAEPKLVSGSATRVCDWGVQATGQ